MPRESSLFVIVVVVVVVVSVVVAAAASAVAVAVVVAAPSVSRIDTLRSTVIPSTELRMAPQMNAAAGTMKLGD